MNQKLKTFLSVFLMLTLCLALTACAGDSSDLNTVTATDEDFRYTLQADTLEYKADALDPAKPFHVTLSIEYTGDQDTVDVWCVEDLGTISMEDGNGKALLSEEYHSRDTSRVTLEKGTPYVIEWTGASEYKEYGGIPVGQYKVVAYLNFSTDATYDSIRENTLNLSLTVK